MTLVTRATRAKPPAGAREAAAQTVAPARHAQADSWRSRIRCLVCGEGARAVATDKGRRLLHCLACGLHFFDAHGLPHDLYARAYDGEVADASMQEFQFRSAYLAPLDDTAFLMSPAVRLSLNWLACNARRGATVLDVGAGWGVMLRELRRRGYRATGTDLAPALGAVLEAQGFPMFIGPVEQYPQTLPQPDVITCNFVLHHPEEPIRFLRSIAQRFPSVPLLLTEGLYPNWMHGLLPAPRPEYPRQMTSWSPEALRRALEQGGYARHSFTPTTPSADDVQLPLGQWAARLTARVNASRPRSHRPGGAASPLLRRAIQATLLLKRLVYGGFARYARARGRGAASVLVVAWPDGAPAGQE